jgi:response regulator of citrate/malate metabolism
MAERGNLLLVEDDVRVSRIYRNELKGLANISVAMTRREAEVLVDTQPIFAALIDIFLPDGLGIDVGRRCREKHPRARITFISGDVNRELLAAADELDAGYLVKPLTLAQMGKCARKATEPLDETIARYQLACALSPAETDILRRFILHQSSHTDLQAARMVTASTVKSQIRSLLRKTDCNRLADLALKVLRGTLVVPSPTTKSARRSG